MDLRVLAVSEPEGLALVYVDHHDDAYQWGATHRAVLDAEDLLLTVIPMETGGAVNEAMSRGANPSFAISKFAALPEPIAKMLDACADESQLVAVISALSPEWQEIALSLSVDQIANSHPSDIIAVDDQLLQFALALPSERWRVFLHPVQRAVVELPSSQLLLIRGGPGTGKTVCLVHRYMRSLAQNPDSPPVFVSLNRPAKEAIKMAIRSLGYEPKPGDIVEFKDLNSTAWLESLRGRCSAIFIDEGQDLPVKFVAKLIQGIEERWDIPSITISYDPNQAIVQPSGEAFSRLREYADSTTLTYCYRTTSEILSYTKALLTRLHSQFAGKNFQHQHHIVSRRDSAALEMISAMMGPEVVQEVASRSEILEIAIKKSFDLRDKNGNWDGIGVVVVGGSADEIEFLQKREIPAYIPSDVKGLEFFYGVVVDLLPANNPDGEINLVTSAGYGLQAELYVAVTRFRNYVCLLTQFSNRVI
jgi:KaiC/GvpD/RAD55 family RecA-like ATPase